VAKDKDGRPAMGHNGGAVFLYIYRLQRH